MHHLLQGNATCLDMHNNTLGRMEEKEVIKTTSRTVMVWEGFCFLDESTLFDTTIDMWYFANRNKTFTTLPS